MCARVYACVHLCRHYRDAGSSEGFRRESVRAFTRTSGQDRGGVLGSQELDFALFILPPLRAMRPHCLRSYHSFAPCARVKRSEFKGLQLWPRRRTPAVLLGPQEGGYGGRQVHGVRGERVQQAEQLRRGRDAAQVLRQTPAAWNGGRRASTLRDSALSEASDVRVQGPTTAILRPPCGERNIRRKAQWPLIS